MKLPYIINKYMCNMTPVPFEGINEGLTPEFCRLKRRNNLDVIVKLPNRNSPTMTKEDIFIEQFYWPLEEIKLVHISR